ncbi:hypothetical protein vseg_012006 [Gypsophila vaccaria]
MISISTSKSGSNWLDRLRSSRGFPTGDEPNLDRFLASSSSCSSGSSTRSESTQLPRRVNSVGPQNADVAAVLSRLFNMGEISTTTTATATIAAASKKKNCRKQSNPRFFNSANLANNSNNNNNNNNSKELCSSSGDNVVDEEILDIEEDTMNTKEYTRSEVTVIDTSLKEWKVDKLVYRRKDEWKIKDKKMKKSVKVNSKKRKLLANEDDDDDEVKRSGGVGGEGDVNVEAKTKKKILHLNNPRNDKARELLLKEAAEFVGKVHQTRCPCPRPPDKLRIESSPIIPLKSFPSSNKLRIESSPVTPLKSIPSSNNANPDKLRIENSPVILLKSIPSINNNVNGITRLGKSAKKGRPKKFMLI